MDGLSKYDVHSLVNCFILINTSEHDNANKVNAAKLQYVSVEHFNETSSNIFLEKLCLRNPLSVYKY